MRRSWRLGATLGVAVLAMGVVGCTGSGAGSHPTGAGQTTNTVAPPDHAGAGPVQQLSMTVGTPPLQATLTLPSGPGPFPAMVLVSGSGPNDQDESYQSDKPFRDLALGLGMHGIATLRYDKRTHDYPSAIDPETFTATDEYVPDAVAAVDLLAHRAMIDHRRLFVLGHSQGGTSYPHRSADPRGGRGGAVGGGHGAAGHRPAPRDPLPGHPAGPCRAPVRRPTPPGGVDRRPDGQPGAGHPEPLDPAVRRCRPGLLPRPPALRPGGHARSIRQPLLLLQGDRDYEVTVTDDLDVGPRAWLDAAGVTVVQFPPPIISFIDGQGPPTVEDYDTPGVVDPR